MKPAISVLVTSYNRKPFLKLAIESIRKELEGFEPGYEIIVADGGSTDGAMQWLCKQKDIVLILQHNHGRWNGKPVVRRNSGYYVNLLVKSASGKYVCWMTDDAIVVPGAILNAYTHFEQKLSEGQRIGALAFYNNDWPVKAAYLGEITLGGVPIAHYGLFLKQALEEVGYYDEEYVFYGMDDDMSCKLRVNGWQIESFPSLICHCAYANIGARLAHQGPLLSDTLRFNSKWIGILFPSEHEMNRDWKHISGDDKHVRRKFIIPFVLGALREFLVAIIRCDRRFLALVLRIGLRYSRTRKLTPQ